MLCDSHELTRDFRDVKLHPMMGARQPAHPDKLNETHHLDGISV
jgi:hypothetical protein